MLNCIFFGEMLVSQLVYSSLVWKRNKLII